MKRLLNIILPLLGLMTVISCSNEWEYEGTGSGSTSPDSVHVTLSVQLPGQSTPKTYAISESSENYIKTFDVLAFIIDPDDKTEKFSYRSQGALSTDNGSEKVFKVTLLRSNEQYRFVCITNSKAQLDQLGKIEKGTLKEDITKQLIFRNATKWEATSDQQFTPFPMWGESEPTVIRAEMTELGDVALTRMLARMDVALTTDAAKQVFKLESVHLFNRKTRGHIVPNTTEGYWENGKAEKATLPADNEEQNPLTIVEAIEYSKPAGSDVVFEQEIYTFEAQAPSSGLAHEATCLVIGGIYEEDNKATYYRIDFLEKDQKTYKDILRNHLYRVNIVKVEGSGYDTPEEAFDAKNLNMEVEIVMWDQGEMKEIVFDGQYLLAVSRSEFTLTSGEKLLNELTVFTDYPKGWQASVPEDSEWITIIEEYQSGPADEKSPLKFNVQKNETGFIRNGRLLVTAGRLNYVIKINQTPEEDFNLLVMDYKFEPVSELIFPSKANLTYASMNQEINVEWDPSEMECIVDQSDIVNHMDMLVSPYSVRNIVGGTHHMQIEPDEMTDAELALNPFLEKIVRLDFMVNNNSSYKIESVFLRQTNYTVLTDEAESYQIDGGIYGFHAISNTSWTVEISNDPGKIIEYMITTSGNKNTDEGEVVRFKMVDDPNKVGSTATLVFKSPEGRFEPIEVEINGLNETSAEAQGEANCYMMQKDGHSISIPVSRANADGRTRIKTGDILEAELLWTDHSSGLSANGVVAKYSVLGSGPDGDLIVTSGSSYGNAVIAVKVNGEIKWSWHIWVTDYAGVTYTGNKGALFMDRNLGATSVTPGNPGTIGLYYQFGRKDPFPSAQSFTSSTQIPIYNEKGVPTNITVSPVNATDNINNGVMNPMNFYTGLAVSSYDWSTNSGNQSTRNDYLWENRDGSTTVYDPCPAGWQLPRAYFYSESPWANLAWSGYWNASQYGATWNSGIVIGYWPATGYRDATTGAIVTSGQALGTRGFYWAGNVNSWEGRSFSFVSTSYDPHTNSRKSQGQTVRCVRITK